MERLIIDSQWKSNILFFHQRMCISIYNSIFPQVLLPTRKSFDFDAGHHNKLKTFSKLFGSVSLDQVSGCSSSEMIKGEMEGHDSLMLNILSSPIFIFSASYVHVSCWSCPSRIFPILLFSYLVSQTRNSLLIFKWSGISCLCVLCMTSLTMPSRMRLFFFI